MKKGLVEIKERYVRSGKTESVRQTVDGEDQFILTDEQQSVLHQIKEAWDGEKSKELLIHGVTGSGKTEVYLRAIKEC